MIPNDKYVITKQYNLANINDLTEYNEIKNLPDVSVSIIDQSFDKVGRYQIVCEIKIDISNSSLINKILGKE